MRAAAWVQFTRDLLPPLPFCLQRQHGRHVLGVVLRQHVLVLLASRRALQAGPEVSAESRCDK